MDGWWDNPCGPLSKTTGGYAIVVVDLMFVSSSLIWHTAVMALFFDKLDTNSLIFIWMFFGLEVINGLLALILFLGLRQKSLKKCQTYIFGSGIMLILGTVVFAMFLVFNNSDHSTIKSLEIFEKICYPLFYLYKIYSLWVVKCVIVEIVRDVMAHNNTSIKSTRISQKRPNYGLSASSSPKLLARHNRDSQVSYDTLHGIDDIFHQIQFPKEDNIPSELFRVGEELLKMQDDFYVKKGVFEVSIGNFIPVSVKIFKQKVEVEAVRSMLLETKMLSMFKNHPNVIQLLGFCTENIHKGKMILLLEYCPSGSLEDFLKLNYPNFKDQIRGDEFRLSTHSTESEESESIYANVMSPAKKETETFNSRTLVYMSYQIANGLDFISAKGIVHGNISAKNIIVDGNRVKIGNFTFATQLYSYRTTNTPINLTKWQLPWRYMALECMEVLNEKNFTEKSDVWSFGVTLWEIFSLACVPYEGMSTSEFFPKLLQGYRLEKPSFATSQIYNIMRNCWHHNRTQRPKFSELKATFSEILQNMG